MGVNPESIPIWTVSQFYSKWNKSRITAKQPHRAPIPFIAVKTAETRDFIAF
jgi:hypothetical protein